MIKIDGSLFIQIANFIFLIWALNMVLYRPIRKILVQRNRKISDLEDNIEAFQTDAQAKDDAFVAGIKKARADGLKEKHVLLEAAGQEEKRIIERINQKAQADLAAFREKIAQDSEAVRKALQAKTDEFADAIGQKILGRAIL